MNIIHKIIEKWKHRRFCKLNYYYCPDCIYHDFLWEGAVFRGNQCRYPIEKDRDNINKSCNINNYIIK